MENEPIRVLHIVPNMQAGGLETLIMNIYRNIDRTKVQFDFLVHYTGNYFYDDEIRSLGGRIYKLSVRDDNNFIKYLKDLDAFFKKHPEYKIVHGHMESLGQFYFKAAKKNGVPVRVAHSHNSATENTIKGKIKGLLLKRYKVFATDYFACSQKAGEFMFANKKFTVLKNAIIVNNFIYNENERNRLRKELGIKGKIVIGHAGRFCEQKNHKFLIDVFKKIADLENNAVLLLIGAGETFEKVKEQVCEYGLEERVIFLGVRKDIASLYQAMDCFVFPSLFEGLGIVAIEAQCSGLPVVTNKRSALLMWILVYVIYEVLDAWFISNKRTYAVRLFKIMFGIAIGIFILSIVKIKGNTILSLVTGKFTGLFSEDSRSYMQRYGALIIALELILQKNSIFGFLFGNGLSSLVGNFVTNRRTITDLNFYVIDNQYITSWYDSGFVFLILCVFICVHFIIELTKIIGDKHIEISLRKKSLVLLIGMILVMFYSFIIDVLTWYQPIFIISFIIALSNWNIKEAKKECEYTR